MGEQLAIGDVLTGTISGIQDYGVFVQLDETKQGLVHISECRHGFVSNLEEEFKLGQEVKVMIIDIDEYTQQVSLSIRVLHSLNTPPFPARFHKKRRSKGPDIGFESIDKLMPQWIAEGLHDAETNRFNISKKENNQ
ncbi:CvfD/Ygs/GSP13 family RNA-binding post-transcriptional regulator [Eremococcus coleocola]|uniref:S1 RNA binding domain protein n=1 Tax=Eremococcus coleocola ACS-139-V-Col8 TaxID=908337 RepID=E4KND9_9LACT|nr:CvfD/Ygs/GSP13 family RNA-binding post-transcriptional regulator [Eremococcus coleocola]EFR31525.1 S1 RNA binding domain protein [Eremococcus coleocola ACS-139-V-Col8]